MQSMRRLFYCVALLALGAALLPAAAKKKAATVNGRAEVKKTLFPAPAESMKEWQEMRFGMFIHWGPVSLKGTEIGWSRMEPDRTDYEQRGGIGHKGVIPTEEYDNLYKRFNPTKFDAKAWVAVAKTAGMKYMVLTTRHHDGFSEFDSKVSDYKITNSPFGRDVVKEYSDAVHEAGLKLGFYYSQPDWHNPDYLNKKTHKRYIEYVHAQVRELLTNYGKVDIIWFDGLGGKAEDFDAERLFKLIRELQPGIVINNRCGLAGDFDTPEQRIGSFQNTRPWETCMTICHQWAFKPGDTMKTLAQCVQTLASCACGDGNLLFNVGPMPTGEIEPRQVERLREMGAWVKANGETIYGTHGGPYLMGKNGGSTHKGSTVYLHVFNWPEEGVRLPDPERKIASAKLFGKGTEVKLARGEGEVKIALAKEAIDPIDTIVQLELTAPAATIKPVVVWKSGALSMGKPAKASNVFQKQAGQYGPAKALDDDPGTRWATDASVNAATLEVDLGKAETIGGFRIIEEQFPRTAEFTIDIEKEGQWAPVHKGTKIGKELEIKLKAPVQGQKVRLNILKVSQGGPTIQEFQVLGVKK